MSASTRYGPVPSRVFVLSDAVGTRGGAAKATLLLCETLAAAGAAVDVYVTATPDPAIAERLRSHGIRLRTAPVRRGSRFMLPARSLGIRAWLAMMRSRNAVLHAVGMQPEVVQFLSLPGRFRTFVWETTEALPGNKFVPSRAPLLLSKVEALLVPSKAVERNARATYGFTGSIRHLPFWVEYREWKRSPENPAGPKRFLFIGRMDEDKGFRFLIPAFTELRNSGRDAALDICGSGNPSEIPELSASVEGLAVRGSVSDGKLSRLLEDCHAVVLPSLHEGYPLSLLEACSYGRPVVASAVGSIPEVFANRPCAILVPPGDTNALTSAMLTLLDEAPSVYAERAADARALYEQLCSPPTIRKSLARAYRRD